MASRIGYKLGPSHAENRVKPTLAALPMPLEAVFNESAYEAGATCGACSCQALKQDFDQKLRDACMSQKDLPLGKSFEWPLEPRRQLLLWNGLAVLIQIVAVALYTQVRGVSAFNGHAQMDEYRAYWPLMAVVACIYTMIVAARVFFGPLDGRSWTRSVGLRYLNLQRAAQWSIYLKFGHDVSLDGGSRAFGGLN